MEQREYQIRFTTPGFLGDAEQKSVWRTPPFKALIQHWWRVVVAKEYGYDWRRIREAEGRLFGHAWLQDENRQAWAMRSRVRIRLEKFRPGTLEKDKWQFNEKKVIHSEVGFPVGGDLYLGFGPLLYSMVNRRTELKQSAIGDKEENQLILIYPKQEDETFQQVMQLIHCFGTLGGRSRNGWGSINLQGDGIQSAYILSSLQNITRPLSECLKLDWPHAIGADEQGIPLIWQTPERDNWRLVIKDLAQTKIKFRTDLPFPNNKPGEFEQRHLLAYPVTNHKINAWENTGRLAKRLANQLRFKVARTADNQFMGIIFHLPCALPNEMSQGLRNAPSMQQQSEIWKKVHLSLTGQKDLKITRISP